MEELKLRYTQLEQAYKHFNYMTKKFMELSNQEKKKAYLSEEDENAFFVHRDGLMQRFKVCYELTWKFFKLLLKKNYTIDVTSPKKVFQECYQQKITSQEETEMLLQIIEARNETTHVYDELMADNISQKIITYYPFLSVLIKKVEPN